MVTVCMSRKLFFISAQKVLWPLLPPHPSVKAPLSTLPLHTSHTVIHAVSRENVFHFLALLSLFCHKLTFSECLYRSI